LTSLYIISSDDAEVLAGIPRDGSSVLAITSAAMDGLEDLGIKFTVLEDYYSWSDVSKKSTHFVEEFSSWLKALDERTRSAVNFEHAFSSNGYWLLHRLSNIYYLVCVAEALSKRYESVYMFAARGMDLQFSNPSITLNDLNLSVLGGGLQFNLSLIKHLTGAKVIVSGSRERKSPRFLRESWRSLFCRSPKIFHRYVMLWGGELRRKWTSKSGCFLVIQSGYEVDVLKRHCATVKFLNPMSDLLSDAINSPAHNQKYLLSQTHSLINKFVKRHFPLFCEHLTTLLESYVLEVVARIPSARAILINYIKEVSPKGLMFSKGSETVFEALLCDVAKSEGLPVFFFKHGGVENLFVEPAKRDEFFERNSSIKRVQFVHSATEQLLYSSSRNVSVVPIGKMERAPVNVPAKSVNSQRILYAVGGPAHSTYKDMTTITSDSERWRFARQLTDFCVERNIPLDIKPHPAEWKTGLSFIKRLQRKNPHTKLLIRIIQGGSVERILPYYGAIVFDTLRTRPLSFAFSFNIPIILYVPDRIALNQINFKDLVQRVYLISDLSELRTIMDRFKKLDLPTRWSRQFIEKYLGYLDAQESIQNVKKIIFSSDDNVVELNS